MSLLDLNLKVSFSSHVCNFWTTQVFAVLRIGMFMVQDESVFLPMQRQDRFDLAWLVFFSVWFGHAAHFNAQVFTGRTFEMLAIVVLRVNW
jgi:hypothetical protein